MNKMSYDIPLIKPFIKDNKCYFYDTYTNRILSVTKEQFFEIKELLELGIDGFRNLRKKTKAYIDIIQLLDMGFLRSQIIEQIIYPDEEYIEHILDRGLSSLELQVTKNCNFKCRYCLFACESKIDRTHKYENMSWDIAKTSIDYLYNHSQDVQDVSIAFYGGEPLLNFELIKKSMEYAKELFETKRIYFHITSNCSFINEEIIQELIKYNVFFLISLDGPPQIQDYHRRFGLNGSETFDAVWTNVNKIRAVDSKYFDYNVRFNSVLFPDESEEEVFSFFSNNGISETSVQIQYANLAGIDYDFSKHNISLDITPYEQIKVTMKAKYSQIKKALDTKTPLNVCNYPGGCIPGVVRLFVNSKGIMYPCEKVLEKSPLAIGDIWNGINKNRACEILNIAKLTEENCKKCWAFRFCKICVLHCFDSEENTINKASILSYCAEQKKIIEIFLKNQV